MSENQRSTFDDVKDIKREDLPELCQNLRDLVINSVEKCGGHLASNLGVVELTVALHRVLDMPKEKLIFDVSHQSYVHKMLTGREDGFEHLRDVGGVSGFQTRSESEYDFFGGGHSGTAISAALGFAEAEKLNGGKNYAVAVVGDGSFTNGMVYEALNNASKKNLRLIIILNDNEMSISKNVGGMSKYFERLRSSVKYFKLKRGVKKVSKIKLIGRPIAGFFRWVRDGVKRLVLPENIFENLGMAYIGPVNGHDIFKLEAVLREAKQNERPTVIHVCTVKGKGYEPAEQSPSDYHAYSPASAKTEQSGEYSSFSECFGKTLTELARDNENIVAVTAAMCDGTGLTPFKTEFKQRFFDVGIAESHAVTFSAGLSAAGKIPVFAVYSAFLQRGFDQIIHDVSIQGLPVVFAIDRSGFVPGDGPTHQGIFDLAFLLSVPKMTVYTPSNYADMREALKNAVGSENAVAIRYPKASESDFGAEEFTENEVLRYRDFGAGRRVNIVTYGTSVYEVCKAAEMLSDKFYVRVISIKRPKPLDITELYELLCDSELTVFVEEQVKKGGFAEGATSELCRIGKPIGKFEIIAVDECYPTHASISKLREQFKMDATGISKFILEIMQ